jgi:ATP-dependent Clp protease ATP-binding subunit ClpA
MHGYNFTERVRHVLAMARDEAVRLGHEFVGPEHILLALLREGEGVAVVALSDLGVSPGDLAGRVNSLIEPPSRHAATGPDLPYTSRGKKTLELAMTEAREMHHTYVGTEHLFLGLLREEKSIAAQVLIDSGVTLGAAREAVQRILGDAEAGVAKGRAVEHLRWMHRDAASPLPEAFERIVSAALEISRKRGLEQPRVADLLEAVVFSSREVAAAFASREIEMQGLLEEIRGLTETHGDG